tara:strand:+ start:4184 stop:6562 length:2379 start_codon:yes stop_codon:yes gene_type:complete
MILKIGFLISYFLFFSTSTFSMSAWDKNNEPELMRGQYINNFGKLPLSGELSKTLWSGDYWPSYHGGITYRWNQEIASEKNEVERFGYNLLKAYELKNFNLATLSPSEKYDLYLGDLDFTLTRYERQRTQVLKTVEGSPEYNKKFKIPEWEGLCHAWAPATIHYKNPEPVEVIGRLGHVIPFGSSDIKALLTYNVQLGENSNIVFMGSRCNLDFSKLEEKLKKGLISEKEYEAAISRSQCKDTNAGAFHIALANQIGIKDESFIIDITRDLEVWNQAVQRYSSKILDVYRGASKGAAPGTVKEVLVETVVDYITEIPHSWTNEIPKDSIEKAEYLYWLEIDRKGMIIGGSWESFERPDFIWKQGPTPFTGFFEAFKPIYNKSVNKKGEYLKNKWRNVSRKVGRDQLLKKKFVKGLKGELLRKKLLKAAKMALLKKRFLKTLEEERKKKRIQRLQKKFKTFTKDTGKSKVVVNKIKGEVLKTKWKRDALRNLKIKKSLKKLKRKALATKLRNQFLRSLYLRKALASWKGRVIERNFYKNVKKSIDAKKFSKKLKSEVLKTRLQKKVGTVLKAKDFGNKLKSKVVVSKWVNSVDKVSIKRSAVSRFEGEVLEKELASSLKKYKNVDRFRKGLKRKIEEKKELQLAIFEAIQEGNSRFFFNNVDSIDLNMVNRKGQNALMLAAKYSRLEMLEALIQKGGKKLVNNVDKFGRHSLSILLLQLSRNFESVEDKDSQEALVDEAFRVVRLLVKNGADVNKKDLSGRRPRYYARLIRKITRRYTKKIDRYLKDRGGKKR